ncbi:MAG TPA: mandelate racemase/muconate lactonizing enzyme family protein [Vicinamibacterales bacterium]|nr:mandelate racemase/muconate lactonizing enzyme family protein [Vicinamibacterales bacterium]
MNRRSLFKSIAIGVGGVSAGLIRPAVSEAALPPAKVTRVKCWAHPGMNRSFNQSALLVTVETDTGITGIGEGGSKDLIEQIAGSVVGQDPFRIERNWHHMYMDTFYPPGRERVHAQGAIDLALWDIKGKALQLPVHSLLHGLARNYVECYATTFRPAGSAPPGAGGRADAALAVSGSALRDRARAAMEEGYRVFRVDASIGGAIPDNVFNTHERVRLVAAACKDIRDGVGKGDWMIDFHQKFDFADALRCCKLIEEYEPYLVEDPVRDEQALEEIPKLRKMTTCPLAHGEEWGQRWNFHRLLYDKDIDYIRATLPNVGGITEMVKVMALCETSAVGIVPHFTGPVATAALVHTMGTFSGPVLMEYNYGDRPPAYLAEFVTFRNGRLYPNDRPGLGVTVDFKALTQIAEFDQARTSNVYSRPDGSLTHW